jgi:uncharacterized protein (TIGR02001 family)
MRLFMSHYFCDEHKQQTLGSAAWLDLQGLRMVLVSSAILAAPATCAQTTSASVSAASEYAVRGVSLSDGLPSPQVGLAWDWAQGWYAGAFAAGNLQLAERPDVTQLVAYGGYVHRLASGLSWEAGGSSNTFINAAEYNYGEVYAGLASDHVSGRATFSPSYYGYGGRVVYAELNAFHPLAGKIKLIGHIGLLHGLRGTLAEARDRVDLRLAIGFDIDAYNIQLAWLHSTNVGAGATDQVRTPRALAISASYSF